MEICKIAQYSPEFKSFAQKTERINSKGFFMKEFIHNSKFDFEIKINSIISILLKMKKENDQNLEKSKKQSLFNLLLFLNYSFIIL